MVMFRSVSLFALACEPPCNLVVTYGNDGEEDIVIFSVVRKGGDSVATCEALTHRLIVEEDPRAAMIINEFGRLWGFGADDAMSALAAADVLAESEYEADAEAA